MWDLEEEIKKLIKVEEGKVTNIDWKGIHDNFGYRACSLNTKLYDEVLERLVKYNVLSRSQKGNFGIGSFGHNPGFPGNYFFKREEDAEAYRTVAFGRALYPTSVIKYEE